MTGERGDDDCIIVGVLTAEDTHKRAQQECVNLTSYVMSKKGRKQHCCRACGLAGHKAAACGAQHYAME